ISTHINATQNSTMEKPKTIADAAVHQCILPFCGHLSAFALAPPSALLPPSALVLSFRLLLIINRPTHSVACNRKRAATTFAELRTRSLRAPDSLGMGTRAAATVNKTTT